ncbi:alkylated DNA repair protein ALKBH6 homolog isoform X2 [Humulus lupulus]|nr:alkylated DNA repair protein ALKBH6 homolog isoform X2 [Humulus lupulus]
MEGEDNHNKVEKFKVGSLPTLMYIPDFITHDQQTILLNNINGAPQSKWKSLKNRRLQNWGGIVHEKGLLSQQLPPWLMKITQKICEESGLFPAPINHVLINEYLPNQGIMPHQDGPAYFPVVAILSLGSPAVMDFTPHSRLMEKSHEDDDQRLDDHQPFSVLLMPRSLLIFKDSAYSDYLHGIKDSKIQSFNGVVNEVEAYNQPELDFAASQDVKNIHRTTSRVSLTCRLVLKVHKNLFKV